MITQIHYFHQKLNRHTIAVKLLKSWDKVNSVEPCKSFWKIHWMKGCISLVAFTFILNIQNNTAVCIPSLWLFSSPTTSECWYYHKCIEIYSGTDVFTRLKSDCLDATSFTLDCRHEVTAVRFRSWTSPELMQEKKVPVMCVIFVCYVCLCI